MFQVRNNDLYFDQQRLGPKSGLYVDSGELPTLHIEQGVRHLRMPYRIDAVFLADQRIVGVESKRRDDLISSIRSRRLARQMRTLHAVVDAPVLLLRGGLPDFDDGDYADIFYTLLAHQCIGTFLLFAPSSDEGVLRTLYAARSVLATGSRSPLVAVAGEENNFVKTGGLLRGVKGLGPRMEERLRNEFGSTLAALNAGEAGWERVGVSPGVRQRLQEALE